MRDPSSVHWLGDGSCGTLWRVWEEEESYSGKTTAMWHAYVYCVLRILVHSSNSAACLPVSFVANEACSLFFFSLSIITFGPKRVIAATTSTVADRYINQRLIQIR